MADTYDTDEFSFPLRSLERLHLQQGGRLSEGSARPADLPSRHGIDIDVPGDLGFTAREYLDAQFELYCRNLRAGMTVRAAIGFMEINHAAS